MKSYLCNIIFRPETSIKKVLSQLNITATFTSGKGFGMVVNEKGKCIGTISDGDIRRSLNNHKISDSIKDIYNKKFIYIHEGGRPNKILRIFEQAIKSNHRTLTFPVLKKDKSIVDIINYDEFLNQKNSPQFVKAKVPIRISFSGGGTDFSNHINKKKTFILSSTIDKFIFVSIHKRNDKKIYISNKSTGKDYFIKNLAKKKNNKELIDNILKVLNPNFGFDMFIDSDFDPGTGLGGSSALTLAIVACLKRLQNERMSDYYNLINSAYKCERMVSKISGGWQDYYTCFMGGFNWIEMDQSDNLVSALKVDDNTVLELESNILLFRFGKERSSGNIQKKNHKFLNRKSNKINNLYNLFKKNSLNMKKSLLQNNINNFSKLLDNSWKLKKQITPYASNIKIDKIYNELKKIGMEGGKILGAGQSGYFLAYAEPKFQKKIVEFLKKRKIIQTRFNFTSKGMQIWERY